MSDTSRGLRCLLAAIHDLPRGTVVDAEQLWSNRPLTRHVQQDLLAEVGA